MMLWFVGFMAFLGALMVSMALWRIAGALEDLARNVANAGDRARDEHRRTARAAEQVAEDFRTLARSRRA